MGQRPIWSWITRADNLDSLSDNGDRGRIYEIGVSHPQKLQDRHNDLPLLPRNDIPSGSEVNKLTATNGDTFYPTFIQNRCDRSRCMSRKGTFIEIPDSWSVYPLSLRPIAVEMIRIQKLNSSPSFLVRFADMGGGVCSRLEVTLFFIKAAWFSWCFAG